MIDQQNYEILRLDLLTYLDAYGASHGAALAPVKEQAQRLLPGYLIETYQLIPFGSPPTTFDASYSVAENLMRTAREITSRRPTTTTTSPKPATTARISTAVPEATTYTPTATTTAGTPATTLASTTNGMSGTTTILLGAAALGLVWLMWGKK